MSHFILFYFFIHLFYVICMGLWEMGGGRKRDGKNIFLSRYIFSKLNIHDNFSGK